MPDREKVIKALECCCSPMTYNCKSRCPYASLYELGNGYRNCMGALLPDALVLLKEQEPVEPHYTTLRYLVNGKEVAIRHPECPRCMKNGLFLWDAEIEEGQAYCKRCGQAVKWNDKT